MFHLTSLLWTSSWVLMVMQHPHQAMTSRLELGSLAPEGTHFFASPPHSWLLKFPSCFSHLRLEAVPLSDGPQQHATHACICHLANASRMPPCCLHSLTCRVWSWIL